MQVAWYDWTHCAWQIKIDYNGHTNSTHQTSRQTATELVNLLIHTGRLDLLTENALALLRSQSRYYSNLFERWNRTFYAKLMWWNEANWSSWCHRKVKRKSSNQSRHSLIPLNADYILNTWFNHSNTPEHVKHEMQTSFQTISIGITNCGRRTLLL